MAVRVTQTYVTVLRPLNTIQNVTQSMSLVSAANPLQFYGKLINGLALSQTATHNFVYETIVQTIDFSSVAGTDVEEFITQYLGFTPRHFVATGNTVFHESLIAGEHRGALAWPVQEETLGNTVGASQTLTQAYMAMNSLSLAVATNAAEVQDCLNTLTFQAVVDSSATEYERDAQDHCCRQHVSFSISGKPCVEKQYAPFVGSSDDDAYDEVEITEPTLTVGTLTLTYPFVSPTTTLELKNPTFGNTDELRFKLIDRVTRGGDRIIFGDTKWGSANVQDFTVENATTAQMEAFVAFVNESLGKEIGILDWEGRQWQGVIIAPESPITETVGGFRLSIRFQGELA